MKPTNSSWNILHRFLFLLPFAFCFTAPIARGEGSIDLIKNGGNRPLLEFRETGGSAELWGLDFKTVMKVYAEEGETINLGSSAVGLGSGIIRYRAPNSDPNDVPDNCGATGLITDSDEEAAGPLPNVGGFTPCIITVGPGEAGVWEIEFVSPNPAAPGGGPNIPLTGWTQLATHGQVIAWDITVRDGGVDQIGRVFSNSMALNMGSNNRRARSDFYIQTRQGYQYFSDLNGIDPAGFIFFANQKGFINPDGTPRYQSVPIPTFLDPVPVEDPTDFANDNVTHKIFLNEPDTTMPLTANSTRGTTWLYQAAPPTVPEAQNFTFTGIEGTPNQAGTSPLGGNFSFDVPANFEGSYAITLDLNNNGTYGDGIDRTLVGQSVAGITNTVFWDGRDKNGALVPAGTVSYNATITLNAGEVHFPFLDIENNLDGIIIRNTTSNNATIYYDNNYPNVELNGTPPDPLTALEGVNSAGGALAFSGGFGNNKGLDIWSYVPSAPREVREIVQIKAADLQITKNVSSPGLTDGPVTYTIQVTNAGPSDIIEASPATFTDNVPADIINVDWTCEITTGTGSCGTENGTGNTINATLALNNGAVATFTVTGTIAPNAPEPVINTATITRPNDVTDPMNNDGIADPDPQTGVERNRSEQASATINTLTPGNPLLGVAKQLNTVVNNGDGTYDATYTIRVENFGNLDILTLQVTEDLFGNAESTFASAVAAPQIITAPQIVAGTLTGVNPDFNGNGDKNLLLGSETLPVGESIDITFTVRVTPGSQLGPYENTATATGTSPGGTVVSDDSTDDENLNPDTNNDDDPTNDTTPTSVTFGEVPLIGVAKAAGTPTDNGDRTFTIPYTLVVRNYGDVPLNTVQVTENLNETFSNLTYTLEPNSLSSPTLTVNPSFNGDTNINLLATGNTLAVDTEATINFAVRVTPGNNLGPFNNQVTASGVTPGGTGVNDLSTNGSNPDGNNSEDPTDSNEITSVTLRGNPNLELEKRITRVNGAVVGQSENLADWPTNFVRGVASSNTIQPGDEVEYTIYFLSSGSGPLENAMVCDPLQDFQTFRTDTFNGQTPTEGTFGAEVGIALALNPPNPDLPTAYLRSANSASNRGRFYPSGTATPLICEQNVRGAVVVDIGELGVGDYGFIRFRVTID
ncbi:DUF11 domain-containing protein [Oscillatoria sp. HE19RPO]|uniref:DUF11 domain-containing protein n=1 Tax=Oscillatoria sp. HE19RPO TaxID=2954806 RepID=UPI0020C46D91|nr:DUF11 domain-containing protein [Oscillatoria sp. HE19RPO]